mmetsp:Transcript_122295/g.340861  ORF Transcript_122295/g.340861 Transcript_122295/m.340861 type:complete len:278 (-) Transcript_122295:2-835(-)
MPRTSSRYTSCTGKVRPGTEIEEAPGNIDVKAVRSMVADMSTTRKCGKSGRRSRSNVNNRSTSVERSCTSSTTRCVQRPGPRRSSPSQLPPSVSLLNSTPSVQKRSWHLRLCIRDSPRTLKPTAPSPSRSPRSSATRCATEVAATRRGCVTTTRAPAEDSSRNWPTCVVLPQPVSPWTMSRRKPLTLPLPSSFLLCALPRPAPPPALPRAASASPPCKSSSSSLRLLATGRSSRSFCIALPSAAASHEVCFCAFSFAAGASALAGPNQGPMERPSQC